MTTVALQNRIFVPLFLLALSACSGADVQYSTIEPGRLDVNGNRTDYSPDAAIANASASGTYFSLRTTQLTIEPTGSVSDWSDVAGKASPFAMTALPAESDVGFSATPKTELFQRGHFSMKTTTLAVEYLEGTHVPSTVTATVTDNTQAVLQTVGTIATGIMSLSAAPPARQPSPANGTAPSLQRFVIVLPDYKTDLPSSATPIKENAGWKYQIALDDPTTPTALKLVDFKARVDQANASSDPFLTYFPFAACRQAKVTLISPNDNRYFYFPQVGTPEWLEIMAIPSSGKITAGKICGASFAPGSRDPTVSLKDVSAAISLANSLTCSVATTKSKTSTPASSKSTAGSQN
jgi:hypothetical protein